MVFFKGVGINHFTIRRIESAPTIPRWNTFVLANSYFQLFPSFDNRETSLWKQQHQISSKNYKKSLLSVIEIKRHVLIISLCLWHYIAIVQIILRKHILHVGFDKILEFKIWFRIFLLSLFRVIHSMKLSSSLKLWFSCYSRNIEMKTVYE